MDTAQPDDETDRLRAEVAEWRRRAEIAEAVSAERLTRAETAESALDAARAALRAVSAPASGSAPGIPVTAQDAEPPAVPPRSLRERWRRYIDSVN